MNRRSSDFGLYFLLAGCCIVLVVLLGFISCMSCRSCRAADDDDELPIVHTTQNDPPRPSVRITFQEGKNAMQYAEMLEEKGVCTAQEFVDAMNGTDYSADFPFLPAFEKLEGRPYKLEGYLFPDTYDFYLPESADSVIRRFLKNFQAKVDTELITAARSTGDYYNQQLTFDDVLIMASIVEREASSIPDEMSGVAAVFYNRMKYPGGTVDGSATGGYFQSDVTKFYPYVYGTAPEDFVSEYNTFNVKGLPKGPICCPALHTIRAAAYPDHEQDAFFFYTDTNNKVYYAVTFSEHQANYKYCRDNGIAP